MNFVLGEYFADVVNRIIDEAGFSLEDIDLIGSHGQTIWHNPKQENLHGYFASSTLQIGEPTIISKRLGKPVVADFRKADMSVGGEGAPLTPYLDYILHKQYDKSIILQNIGGIANLTYLPKNCGINDVIAFDTGPGNMMIDAAVKFFYGGTASFDKDGSHAFKGEVNHDLLIEFLGNPYFSRTPPKSTGREDFGEEYSRNIIVNNPGIDKDDLIATFSDFTAESIVKSYRDFLPEPVNSVYVSGGGSKNLYIMKRLQEKMNPIPVKSYDELGYNSEAKEALLFAVLANEHIMGIPANIPSITGAREPVVLGTLYV
jgi:anhydro-N-acetylmuramic acid kinase